MSRKQSVFSWGQMPLGKHHLLMLALPFLLFATQTQAKFCTSLKAVKKSDAYGQPLCTQSYQAKCGWFTFRMCTFYEEVPCQKGRNDTKVTFKVVTECCKGYILDASNLTCIRNYTEYVTGVPGVTNSTVNVSEDTVTHGNEAKPNKSNVTKTGDPTVAQASADDVDEGESTLDISDGAFAAIASAGLFIICVTVVIIIHFRKKQIREEKRKKEAGNPESQKMIHI